MMKFATSPAVLRPLASYNISPVRSLAFSRCYATHTSLGKTPSSPGPRRKAVTPFNDDGHIPWADLSAGEKTARATQQTFNFGLILAGIGLTGTISYLLYTEVFAPDSKIANFSRSLDLIKQDATCQAILGNPKKIWAHGEETFNKWRRARPISSTITVDRQGMEHLKMHFHVEGPLNRGVAYLHMTRHPRRNEGDFEYKYLFIDVKGHPRIYLRNADEKKQIDKRVKTRRTLFGIPLT